jgi:hypothetical protein
MEKAVAHVFDFIAKHPTYIINTNPYDLHSLINIHTFHGDATQHSTCFAYPTFLCALFRLQAPENGTNVELKMESFNKILKPTYYFLSCDSHHISIVFINSELIYYIDYHSETEVVIPLRIKTLSLKQFRKLLWTLFSNDIDEYIKFQDGSTKYAKEAMEDFQTFPKLLHAIYEQPLSYIPSIKDIIKIIDHPPVLPGTTKERDYTDEDFEGLPVEALSGAIERRKKYIEELRMLIVQADISDSDSETYPALPGGGCSQLLPEGGCSRCNIL